MARSMELNVGRQRGRAEALKIGSKRNREKKLGSKS